MDQSRLSAHIAHLVDDAEAYNDKQQKERRTAYEYYDGIMSDVPTLAPDRSKVTSRDVRATVKKLLPSLFRTFFGSDRVVMYSAPDEESEEAAEEAADYVNGVVIPDEAAEVEKAIRAAILDAMLVRTGILKWCAYQTRKPTMRSYEGLSEFDLGDIDIPEGASIEDYAAEPEQDEMILAVYPEAMRHSFKVRHVLTEKQVKLEAVPRDSFLIMPGARSIVESPLVGERQRLTRSELVEMGYDRDTVYGLPCADDRDDDSEAREGADFEDARAEVRKAMQQVEVFDLYVRLDEDDDGIAELHHIVFVRAGDDKEQGHTILEMEIVDEAPYAAIRIEEEAFQFEGRSIFEDVVDIQRVKTVLQRETLDNIYATNAAQPVYDDSVLSEDGVEALQNPLFGRPIPTVGGDPRKAVYWNVTPFVADKTFAMMEFKDAELEDRTGVTDTSGGMSPEAVNGASATAAQIMADKGMAQTDMYIRMISVGLRRAFEGILRLLIAHSEGPMRIKLADQWREFDPSQWPEDMRATVNVGLGTGSRERDMQALQLVKQMQTEVLTTMGADNPFVKPDQLYNTMEKITEAAGLPSAGPFFTKPDPQEVAQKMQEAANQPNPEQMKLQAQMQMEQVKVETARMKEQAQMEADLVVKRAEIQAKQIADEAKLQLQREKMQQDREMEIMRAEVDLIKTREQAQMRPVMPTSPVPDLMPGGL